MQQFYPPFRLLFFLFCGLFFTLFADAQSIKGQVTDAATKEPIVGTTVLLKETGKIQIVQLDGFFTFKDLKPGDYNLEFRFVSYLKKEAKVTVSAGKTTSLSITLGYSVP